MSSLEDKESLVEITNEMYEYYTNNVVVLYLENDKRKINELDLIYGNIKKYLNDIVSKKNFYDLFNNASEEEKNSFMNTYSLIKQSISFLELRMLSKKSTENSNLTHCSFYDNNYSLHISFNEDGYPILKNFHIKSVMECNNSNVLKSIINFFSMYLEKVNSQIRLNNESEELTLIKESYEKIIFNAKIKLGIITKPSNPVIASGIRFYVQMMQINEEIKSSTSIEKLEELIEKINFNRNEVLKSEIFSKNANNDLNNFMYEICEDLSAVAFRKKYELEQTLKLDLK